MRGWCLDVNAFRKMNLTDSELPCGVAKTRANTDRWLTAGGTDRGVVRGCE